MPVNFWNNKHAALSFFAAAVLLIFSLVSNSSIARAQVAGDEVTIAGRVVNASTGSEAPAGMALFVLLIDQQAETIVGRIETSTDQEGAFEVVVPVASESQFYRVVADDGVFTPYLDFLTEELPEEVIITTYDSTTSLEDISVGKYAMVVPAIDVQNREVGVLTSTTLTNAGDRVYVADLEDPALTGFKLLRFNLPEGYKQLSVESDLPSGNVMEIGTGFALSNPVPPGSYNLLMSYSATFDDGTFKFPLRLPFGASSVSILIPEGSGELRGLGLEQVDTVVINESRYSAYEGSDYPRGSQLDVEITGLPKPSTVQSAFDFFSSSYFRISLIASVALVLVATAAVVWVSASRRAQSEAQLATNLDVIDPARKELVQSIALLDAMYEEGKIGAEEYSSRRRELMLRAIAASEEERTSS